VLVRKDEGGGTSGEGGGQGCTIGDRPLQHHEEGRWRKGRLSNQGGGKNGVSRWTRRLGGGGGVSEEEVGGGVPRGVGPRRQTKGTKIRGVHSV